MALVTAVAQVQFLVWELPHAMGAAKKKRKFLGGLMVKDLALSLLWLRSLLWHGFSLWPRSFCMQWAYPKNKTQKKTKKSGKHKC